MIVCDSCCISCPICDVWPCNGTVTSGKVAVVVIVSNDPCDSHSFVVENLFDNTKCSLSNQFPKHPSAYVIRPLKMVLIKAISFC